ncbi:MAG: hypothetical protein JXB17_08150 [Bacteroidales bacterium]|nr:hypothetical protein [Bacteroidales bacterium]
MKKIIYGTAFLGMIAILFSSCVVTNKGFQSSPVISRNVELDPIKADIKVDAGKKLEGESSSAYILMFRIKGDKTFADGIAYSTDASAGILAQLNPINVAKQNRLTAVRAAAAYNALSGHNYDVLVHPSYTITTVNYVVYKKYSVKVTGYGAYYENFRTEKQKVIITDNNKEYIFPDK